MRAASIGILIAVLTSVAGDPEAARAQAVPGGQELSGRLVLVERGRPARDPSLDLRQSAVWFEPDRQAKGAEGAKGTAAVTPVTAEMTTVRKQFSPQLLVVPVGSTVRFPNQDPILHNVFSVSAGNRFDLGLVGAGTGKTATFRAPGIVQVYCNVHHGMFAHVLVVATPHYARPDASGDFALAGLPAGAGTLHYWHERGAPAAQRVTLPRDGPVTLELPVTVPRVPPHRNKQGKAYGRGAYE